MSEPFDKAFLDRRIGQLWAEANGLTEGSLEQARIERLASALSDYLIALHRKSRADLPNRAAARQAPRQAASRRRATNPRT